MSDLAGRRVVVVGLGASGRAAARVLASSGARVRVTEARPRWEVAAGAEEAEAGGAEVLAGGHRPEHLEGANLVVVSPGVPERAEVLTWARQRKIPVWSELELGARVAGCPYVGVTGTNGKTTTTEMIAAAMRHAGLDAIACGNVGYPFSLAATEGHDALAVEASSFQLRLQDSFHPRVSVLLNLAPDHLDWHGSFDAYRDAKRRIFARQAGDDVHVGNRDDAHAAEVSRTAPCTVKWFSLGPPRPGEVGVIDGRVAALLGEQTPLGMPASTSAPHVADAAAAAAAGLAFGLDPAAVTRAVEETIPLPHRGAVVAEIDGVRYVDDSKATNPHAALGSLAGLENVVLIAGGRSKGIDLSPLAAAIPALAGAVVIGEAADELETLFSGRVAVRRAGSMEDAVAEASRLASAGGTVLLAPACASQDMFRDYQERGERFATAARELHRTGATRG